MRDRRRDLLLTQEELAARAAIGVRTVRDLETGRSSPRADTLRRLLTALAAEDPGPGTAARPAASGVDRLLRAPAQLPPVPGSFVGRSRDLQDMAGLLLPAGPGSSGVVALCGTAGVGKTALALWWAHRSAAHFPDGQLFVDLQGYDPAAPRTPFAALATFLRELDPSADPPHDLAGAANRYRTLIEGRRMLVVLDNASSAEQVRPLLPGTTSCRVVVTSRDSLAGLVARDGVHRVDVDLLPAADAVALLGLLVPDRVAADPGAASVLAERCARLPLALRIAAEIVAARPDLTVAELAGRLADESARLDVLQAEGDPRVGVAAAFSWSYRLLDPPYAQAFRLLALAPHHAPSRSAAAVLLGLDVDRADRVLDVLARAHLVERSGTPARSSMHDLLRAYGRRLAAETEPAADRDAALTRLVDHQLAGITACVDVLYPYERDRRPAAVPEPGAAGAGGGVLDAGSARAWLDLERDGILALGRTLTDPRWSARVVRLSRTLWRHLFVAGCHVEALELHTHALAAARSAGDLVGAAFALRQLVGVRLRIGDYTTGLTLARDALALTVRLGDEREEGGVLNLIGVLLERLGRLGEAAVHYERAYRVAERTGDRLGEASTLNNLGTVLERLGRYDEAIDHYLRALAIRRAIGDRSGEGLTLGNLGTTYRLAGRHDDAFREYRDALAIAREVGERNDEAYALDALGAAHRAVGRTDEAAEHHRQALDVARRTGNRPVETSALNGLGEVSRSVGSATEAVVLHHAAHDLAVGTGDRYQRARALAGTGDALDGLGHPAAARWHRRAALILYVELGVPEAAEVRALLARSADRPGDAPA